MQDVAEWTIIRDIEDWEEFYGSDDEFPDEFPLLASWVDGVAVTVNEAVATTLTDYCESLDAVVYQLFDIDTYGSQQ